MGTRIEEFEDDDAVDIIRSILSNQKLTSYAKMCDVYEILRRSSIITTHIFGKINDGRPANEMLVEIFGEGFIMKQPEKKR